MEHKLAWGGGGGIHLCAKGSVTPQKSCLQRGVVSPLRLHSYSVLTLSLPLGYQMLEKGFPPACRMLQNFLLDFQLLSHFYVQQTSPSKCAGSDSHLVQIGWKALARSGPDDSCTLQTGLFGPNLTQSARTKSFLGWFCTILSGTSVEEQN